jgi:hypothetical protein
VHALRAPGEDDRGWFSISDLGRSDVVGHDLGIDAEFTNPPGDELRVLCAEIDNEHHLIGSSRAGTSRNR